MIIGLVACLAGCVVQSPAQGYPGMMRSEHEVALVRVSDLGSGDRTYMRLSHIVLDGSATVGSNMLQSSGVAILPGYHSIDFDWSFQDESNSEPGLNLVWNKSGHCHIAINALPGEQYLVVVLVDNDGSWFSDPRVRAEVRDLKSLLSYRQVGDSVRCSYGGRGVGTYLDLSKEL